MTEINDADERLLWLLRRAGDEWGATGVAKVAARLAEPEPTLYVNHPRTEPVPGDVARDADDESVRKTWFFTGETRPGSNYGGWARIVGQGAVQWSGPKESGYPPRPDRLRLLVDGETGQVVP